MALFRQLKIYWLKRNKILANGKSVDATQELVTVGLANVVNSFFQGYRINGGLARASINSASGGRTPLINVYVGGIVILALMYLAEYFYYIPTAVLAAIIIAAVIFQLQYHVVIPMWKSKSEFFYSPFWLCIFI